MKTRILYPQLLLTVLITACTPYSSLYSSSYIDSARPVIPLNKDIPNPPKETNYDNLAPISDQYSYHGEDMTVDELPAQEIDYTGKKDICITIPKGGKKKVGNPYIIDGVTYYPIDSAEGFSEEGVASWYGPNFHGKLTANGEVYNQRAMTAAHKTLPIPTLLMVENLENGRHIVVRVNDRGPFSKGRIIDLSEEGAKRIDMIKNGTAKVKITVLSEDPNCYALKGVPVNLDNGSFAVQIRAFSLEDNAETFIKLLDDDRIKKETSTVDNITWHRLYISGFNSKTDAETERNILDADHPGSFVIAK